MSTKTIHFVVRHTSFPLLLAAKTKAEEFGWKYVESFTPFNRLNADAWKDLYFCNDWTHDGKTYPRGISLTGASDVTPCLVLPKDWDKFCELVEKHQIVTKISVKLNENYTAEVTKKDVKVGCQHFSHSKIKEVYDASVKMQDTK